MSPPKIRRDVCGNTDLYKLCCALYYTFYIYDFHWIILSYTTSFIYWIFIWVITYLYPLQVCGRSLVRFKKFRMFWPSSFLALLVKYTDNFWKIRGLIDGFNEPRRQITSGVEKTVDESMSAIWFHTTPNDLLSQDRADNGYSILA